MKKIQCPMCYGAGGHTEVILDDGTGPFEYCGYCNGTGEMKKNKFYYQCLGWLSAASRFTKQMNLYMKRIYDNNR